jgi:Protein of unknown function (DUF1254)
MATSYSGRSREVGNFSASRRTRRFVTSSLINTSQAGPVVIEVPATGDAALNGTIIDAWQLPLIDLGIAGEDQGKGGKYLLLPPNYQGVVPTFVRIARRRRRSFRRSDGGRRHADLTRRKADTWQRSTRCTFTEAQEILLPVRHRKVAQNTGPLPRSDVVKPAELCESC